jgi:hypothetical protein
MAKRLACVDIAQVDFDRGQLNAGNSHRAARTKSG